MPLGISALPASQPAVDAQVGGGIFVALLVWTALAIPLAIRFGVFRRGSIVGPKRLPDQGGGGPLLLIVFITFFTWVLGSAAFFTYRQALARVQGLPPTSGPVLSTLSPGEFAFISTIPPIVAFTVMIGAGLVMGSGWLDRLGFSLRKLGSGVAGGIVGFFIIGPAVLWAMLLSELVYRLIHFEHPAEHVLLKTLDSARADGGGIFWAIIAAISVCAPFFEELFFRGHIQTFIRQLAMLVSAKAAPVADSPEPGLARSPLTPLTPLTPDAIGLRVPGDPPPLPSHFRPDPSPRSILQPSVWHGWTAIIATSLIFAFQHELWSVPPIFVLALGLGYIYERTGNLWAAITIHCLFNSVETVQYILLVRGGH